MDNLYLQSCLINKYGNINPFKYNFLNHYLQPNKT